MDNPKKALMPITEQMVKRGLEVLGDFVGHEDEDHTDTQLVIAIYSEMWKIHMAETDALRKGKQPKSLEQIRNTLIMAPSHGH